MASQLAPDVASALELHAPAAGEALGAFHTAVWAALDPVLLELCRRRIAMLHGDTAEVQRHVPGSGAVAIPLAKLTDLGRWPDSSAFTEAERTCLAFTELFVASVASITRQDVDDVVRQLGDADTYGLVHALLAFDQQQRLRLALRGILGRPEVPA